MTTVDKTPDPSHHRGLSAINLLLHRAPPQDYVQDWEALLGREKSGHRPSPHHAQVIFTLGVEYLALSSLVVGQITILRRVHRVPHMKNPVIRGVVNINGRLRLFFSLKALLGIDEKTDATAHPSTEEVSMIMIEQNSEVWTFAVDRIVGVVHCDLNEMRNVPVTVSKSTANYVKGVLCWRDKQVALLDEELLFFSLRRSL